MKLYALLGLALLTATGIFASDNDGSFRIEIPALKHIEETQKTLDFTTRNLMTMGVHLNRTLEQLPANIATLVDQRVETASKEIKKELSTRPKQIGIIAASLPAIYYGVPLFAKGVKSAIGKNDKGEPIFKLNVAAVYYIGAGALLSIGGFFGIVKSDKIAEKF